MDIDLYQNAFVDFGAIGQNFNIALQTAADFFTQGFNPFGEANTGAGAGADVNADIQGPSSQVAADVNASLATSSNDTAEENNGGGLGLGLGLNINL